MKGDEARPKSFETFELMASTGCPVEAIFLKGGNQLA